MDDYSQFRGKCKEYAEAEAAKNPKLRVVRGWYLCPIWGKQQHWWCVDPGGKIVDPTARQFPSKGIGEYEEFDGWVACAECGCPVHETEAKFEGHYAFCSSVCFGKYVGLL